MFYVLDVVTMIGGANIVDNDIKADNGVIHVIDQVFGPQQ